MGLLSHELIYRELNDINYDEGRKYNFLFSNSLTLGHFSQEQIHFISWDCQEKNPKEFLQLTHILIKPGKMIYIPFEPCFIVGK